MEKGKRGLGGIGQTSPATQWRGFQIRRIRRTSHGREGNRTRHPEKRTRKSLFVFQTAASSQSWLCEAPGATGQALVGGEAELGAELQVLLEPHDEACLAPLPLGVRPWRRLQGKWPRSGNLAGFRSLVGAGAGLGTAVLDR